MIFLVVGGMYKYTTVYSDGQTAAKAFADMPASLKAILGFGSFDVSTLIGFFGMMYSYILLAAAIHAVSIGAGIISKEERDKTTEFLMIKPVSRSRVITSKLFTAVVNVLVINILSCILSAAMVASFNGDSSLTPKITEFYVCMFFVQLVFLSFGTFFAALMKNPKTSASFATGILLITFVLSKVTEIATSLKFLDVLTPFKYFNYLNIVEGKGINYLIGILTLLLITVFIYLTYYFYKKRDLKC